MEPVPEITPQQLRTWQQAGAPFFLLDVREEEERATYHIGGHFVPMDEVMGSHQEIPRDIPVVIYCRKGVRSAIVIQRLQARFGFTNLFNLKGGIHAWKSLGL